MISDSQSCMSKEVGALPAPSSWHDIVVGKVRGKLLPSAEESTFTGLGQFWAPMDGCCTDLVSLEGAISRPGAVLSKRRGRPKKVKKGLRACVLPVESGKGVVRGRCPFDKPPRLGSGLGRRSIWLLVWRLGVLHH